MGYWPCVVEKGRHGHLVCFRWDLLGMSHNASFTVDKRNINLLNA